MIEEAADPLAKVTLSPRGFTALLATAGLLLGLILALIPVSVPTPDPVNVGSVSCGNTIGGVETGSVAANLPPDRATVVAYIDICADAISTRQVWSWPLFLAAGLIIIWMGVVRRKDPATRPASVDSSPQLDPRPV